MAASDADERFASAFVDFADVIAYLFIVSIISCVLRPDSEGAARTLPNFGTFLVEVSTTRIGVENVTDCLLFLTNEGASIVIFVTDVEYPSAGLLADNFPSFEIHFPTPKA